MANKIAKRLENEFKNLSANPICGAKVTKEDDNLYKWKVSLPGPKGSAYEDGVFNLSFDLINYPFKCPEVKFITPIYHPNIKKDTGQICTEVFTNNWAPTEKVSDIIIKLSSLLLSPLMESPFEPEIAQEYEKDYKKWEKTVREFIKYGGMIINNDKKQENKDEKKIIWAENEDEEEIQIYLAKKKSEEEAKKLSDKKKEEEKQFQMAIEESEKYLKNNNIIIEENQMKNKKKEEKFDEEYGICPITQDYMENPVLCPSGNYYEKSAIIKWIEKNHTDPLTRENLTIDMLIEDEEYKMQIIEYRKKFKK